MINCNKTVTFSETITIKKSDGSTSTDDFRDPEIVIQETKCFQCNKQFDLNSRFLLCKCGDRYCNTNCLTLNQHPKLCSYKILSRFYSKCKSERKWERFDNKKRKERRKGGGESDDEEDLDDIRTFNSTLRRQPDIDYVAIRKREAEMEKNILKRHKLE